MTPNRYHLLFALIVATSIVLVTVSFAIGILLLVPIPASLDVVVVHSAAGLSAAGVVSVAIGVAGWLHIVGTMPRTHGGYR